MATAHLGELIPLGGGDPIPLTQPTVTVGRRDSCDLCLKFQNLSGLHCQLTFRDDVWHVTDLASTNGVKVNGTERIMPNSPHPLRPGDTIAIAGHQFQIAYETAVNFEELEPKEELFAQSLMEKAGLEKPKKRAEPGTRNPEPGTRN